ncbi:MULTISPECIES: DUF2796 domain-containing protein [unclassified Mesorhizobium]|uniref:DUF2796 domain-containing protein n=1 Tax=unclassified Mesorhizobium TaxID=325217 RepID=UPI00112A9C5D|nr:MULTISPECIES: DUF2796 domain-containing protein [unclassified Mesorhizobium]MBZ9811867.1 DUF2796 domain-containing protein [Mesorhizobium sp. ESP-6-2]TPM24763.1 DUF2796 domain-containing protein [Mesorhizobium sp. B2-2-2]
MGLHHYAATGVAAGMLIIASAAYAEEEHRELGPHVHGQGTLTLVTEANNVQMEFSAPGMDIVGFEYEAETAREKKAVEVALADLREPFKLFVLPEPADCTVTSADVRMVAGEHEDHDAAAETDHSAEGEEHEGRHTEFRATYALACADAAQITSIYFPFFDRFPEAEKLDVTAINANGETAYEVNRALSRLEEM